MSTRQDGGPAFPTDDYFNEKRYGQTEGLSLRDYFAAAALSAILDVESTADLGEGRCTYSEDVVAKQAYALADAMLRASRIYPTISG